MDILTYLISLSLIVLTVVQTAGLFIDSDKKLQSIQKSFIEQTRDLHRNDKGSVTFAAISLVLIISAVLYFYLGKMQIEYKEAVYRKDSYLCFRFLNEKTKSYIGHMTKMNLALRAAFAARNSVIGGVSGEVAFRALVYARNARHFYYMKELASNKYCRSEDSLNYLTQLPFKTTPAGMLATNFDETVSESKNQWTTTIYRRPRGIRLKKSFCLKTNFSMKGPFFPDLKTSSEEIPIEGLSFLKCLSGPSSSS